jgi:hypothetical protein
MNRSNRLNMNLTLCSRSSGNYYLITNKEILPSWPQALQFSLWRKLRMLKPVLVQFGADAIPFGYFIAGVLWSHLRKHPLYHDAAAD